MASQVGREARGGRLVGMIQTVLGPVPSERLGVTTTHEHLLVDLAPLQKPPVEASRRATFYAPVSMELLGSFNYGGQTNLDNSRLLDVETAIAETLLYRRAGGDTIVEATSIGIGRDPDGLRQIARATGLNVVMGASYYVGASHPADMDAKSEGDVVDEIVRDIQHGVGLSGVRAGVIGEVGCSWPLTPNERKVLRASGRAQRKTGAPLLIHPGRHEAAPREIVEVLRDVDADLSRTIIGHIERTLLERSDMKKLAESGCVLEFDLFGREHSYYKHSPNIDMINDAVRMRLIAWLIAEGHGRQLVLAQDTAAKSHLVRYGGCGYGHILQNIVPRMRSRGIREEDIQTMLVETPRRVLAFAAPRASSRARPVSRRPRAS
jgi:phosphotriesterase-related protein